MHVLWPGEPNGLYHSESVREAFLVLSGECTLLVEEKERPLRQWDFVHCPALTKHTIVGAGSGPSAVLAVGAREHQAREDWGGYTVDEVALRHRAGADRETNDADVAYGHLPPRTFTRYREGWLGD